MYMASRQGDWGIPPPNFCKIPLILREVYSHIDKEEKNIKI